MFKNNETLTDKQMNKTSEGQTIFKKNQGSLKSLIAPAGIDAGYTNHLELV